VKGKSPHIAVIGAGAFGGWTALHLLERGARVTLLDAWEPGHLRGTSSGETRVLRCGYGAKTVYTDWTWRALALWKRWERKWRTQLFVNSGVLWLCSRENKDIRAALAALCSRRIPFQRFGRAALARRYPQMNFAGIRFGILEPRAGFLFARAATMRVAQAVAGHPRGRLLIARAEAPQAKLETRNSKLVTRKSKSGGSAVASGQWLVAGQAALDTRSSILEKQKTKAEIRPVNLALLPPTSDSRLPALATSHLPLATLLLADGRTLAADAFVFACGPWLPQLFPSLLGRRIRVTQQDVFYFGPPPGDRRFEPEAMPVWIEPSGDYYCLPAADARGVKIACDAPGPLFDPTTGERRADPAGAAAARRHLARRLPALKSAPLVETRVCQYERTPDSHLVIGRHPDFGNVWLVGGGSGHGFKLGPAVGEFVAAQILSPRPPAIPAEMRLGASAWPESGPLPVTHSFW
jgi:glycine/D-amino acid oxidase-like deaminating enzyme